MDFLKGTILGMFAGAFVAYMNTSAIDDALRVGKKKYRRIMRRYNIAMR